MSQTLNSVKSIKVIISGRVQGVWFRGWTAEIANSLGISGWVRNRADGTVEALFSGSSKNVDQIIKACWNGPPNARVTKISPVRVDFPKEHIIFHILPNDAGF